MTVKRLSELGIRQYFQALMFFKPEGQKMGSKMSKALAIQELINMKQYKKIIHYDDNPEDVLALADMFPEVEFRIVQDLSTGLLFSRKEEKNYRNVRRITSFDKEIL